MMNEMSRTPRNSAHMRKHGRLEKPSRAWRNAPRQTRGAGRQMRPNVNEAHPEHRATGIFATRLLGAP